MDDPARATTPDSKFRMITNIPTVQYDIVTGSHEALSVYRAVIPDLNAYLLKLGSPYLLTLILVDMTATVYIILDTTAARVTVAYDEVEEELKHMTTLPLLLCTGEVSLGPGTSWFGSREMQKFFKRVPNGASIGTDILSISGSFGFYLANDDLTTVYGLTVAHNFAVGDPSTRDLTTVVYPNAADSNKSIDVDSPVYQPSSLDIRLAKKDAESSLEYENMIKLARGHIPQQVHKAQQAIDAAEAKIKSCDYLLDTKGTKERLFGKVTQIYELATTDSQEYVLEKGNMFLFDYALFSVESNRVGHNAIRERPDKSRAPLVGVEDFSNIGSDMVAKWGRTTDYTIGRRQPKVVSHVGGLPRFPGEVLAFESVIETDVSYFCEKGDSGAGVCLQNIPRAVAVIQGIGASDEKKDKGPHVAFVCNITTILKRIEEKFGLKLRLLTETEADELYASAVDKNLIQVETANE